VAPSRKPADALQATSSSGRLTSDGTNAEVIGRNDPIATPIKAAKARTIGTGPLAASTTSTPDDASAAVNASNRNTRPRPWRRVALATTGTPNAGTIARTTS
jgi:hypothetical protein